MRGARRGARIASITMAILALGACIDDDDDGSAAAPSPPPTAPAATFTLGGTVTGLGSSGLVLANQGVTVALAVGATSFTFPSGWTAGTAYAVTVKDAPAGHGCIVLNGKGTMPAANVGTVQVDCGPAQSVLYSFQGAPDGASPNAGLVEGTDGNLYGDTPGGGTSNMGTIFRITPAGSETVLYRFAGQPADGASPFQSGLVLGRDGNFYGTANNGGAYGNQGTVFRITPDGVETVLWSFGNGNDGANPNIGLIQASDGNFYGTTTLGGANGAGTIFRITPAGVETVLWSFANSTSDGSYPYSGLTEGSDGNFYGVAGSGGTSGSGVFYKITPAGAETVLWSFGTTPIAASPNADIIQAADGNFYGTTAGGGTYGVGTVYRMTPTGVETTLWSFGGGSDANHPNVGLTQGADGAFYGTTMAGGTHGQGALFRITAAGDESVLWSFGATGDGTVPNGRLLLGSDGALYGTTESGGTANLGTVFRYIP